MKKITFDEKTIKIISSFRKHSFIYNYLLKSNDIFSKNWLNHEAIDNRDAIFSIESVGYKNNPAVLIVRKGNTIKPVKIFLSTEEANPKSLKRGLHFQNIEKQEIYFEPNVDSKSFDIDIYNKDNSPILSKLKKDYQRERLTIKEKQNKLELYQTMEKNFDNVENKYFIARIYIDENDSEYDLGKCAPAHKSKIKNLLDPEKFSVIIETN